jgi:predicted aspartyl protease
MSERNSEELSRPLGGRILSGREIFYADQAARKLADLAPEVKEKLLREFGLSAFPAVFLLHEVKLALACADALFLRVILRSRLFISLHCLGVAALCLSSAYAGRSPFNLDVLRRDGYGMAKISPPSGKISGSAVFASQGANAMHIHGTVNGRPATLVVDTGWGGRAGVYLDSNFANTLKLTMEGGADVGHSVSGAAMSLQKAGSGTVVLGNVQLNGVPFYAGKIKGFSVTETRESAWISGAVSGGFLRAASAVLDLPNFRLYLRPPGRGRPVSLGPALKAAGLSEIPFTVGDYGCVVDVEINGLTGKMVVDTGAYFSCIDSRFASQFKGGTYATYTGSIDAAGVVSRNHATSLQTMRVAGVPVHLPDDVAVDKYSFYSPSGGKVVGLLGMDVLGHNWGIIDFGNEKLYLAEAK